MPQVQAKAGVHWLTGSTRRSLLDVQSVLGRVGPPERPGGFGHPHKRVHESGTAVYCGSDDLRQPLVLDVRGEVCDTWADEAVGWLDVLDCRCTRVDLAMDVEPPELARRRIAHMHRAFITGRVKTRMHRDSCSIYKSQGQDQGWTLYLGRPSSELMIRAYDRRGPLRIEAQWRPQGVARELLPELLIRKGAAGMWRRCAKRVEFDLDWYQQLLTGDVEETPSDARVESTLNEAMQQHAHQYGASLFILEQLGFDLADLTKRPDAFSGPQYRKFSKWCDEHASRGQDVTQARKELEKRCPK